MIISLIHEKGGAMKTTLSLALAYYLINKGKNILFVDADTSGNASFFNEKRTEYNESMSDDEKKLFSITMISKTGKTLKNTIRELQNKYEYIIIDTPGRQAIEMQQALFVSDIVIMPTVPSAPDVESLNKTLEFFEEAKYINENLIGVIVPSRASSNPMVRDGEALIKELKNTIKTDGIAIFDHWISERIVHKKGWKEGKTAFEMGDVDTNGQASLELKNFFDAIYGLVENQEKE